ncbi:hypothetical protein HS041_27785 [Planomonospora sp. ID67723]|uniref:hypothetical protein n=1 Tax=Planomonospora sp. ID67723 TaxID=2738134 RepID=UPI0018C43592|nr:hypothetical protein [Planomonospora sp. ID67723]MBG0831541.1 hypothetical protein [Planomonospora sp. ID67723]
MSRGTPTGGDSTVWVWDLAAGKQIGQPRTGHTGIIGALAVGQFGGRTIAVSGDGKLLMWNLGPS